MTGAPGSAHGTTHGGDTGDEVVSDFGISSRHPGLPGTAGLPVHTPDPRNAMAHALRRITTLMVGRPLSDDDIAKASAELLSIADDLEQRASPGRRARQQPDPTGHAQDFFPTSPVIGFANPVAPPVMVELVDGTLTGTAFFDYQYEGPPTCVHGGVIAMVFDELLGAANIAAGCPGMTGTLTIRYRKPTPLRTHLRLEARHRERQGRKIFTWGGIYLDDTLLAEAEGVFIELIPERFLAIAAANAASPEMVEQLEQATKEIFRR
ncbi:MAG: PaaI family thioesterase [Acidimicrobiales bacterium]